VVLLWAYKEGTDSRFARDMTFRSDGNGPGLVDS
jgi:hypothetical protein